MASLQVLVRIESERYHKATGKTEREIRYYVTSLSSDAERLNSVIRQRWRTENKPHLALAPGFGEDLYRKRAGHAAQQFSILQPNRLNLVKHGKFSKPFGASPYLLTLLEI